jgi:hypothetical protein
VTDLSISWSFSPPVNDPDTGYPIQYALTNNNCTMTVTEGGFNISTSYVLTIKVTNNNFTSMVETNTLAFVTGQPPYGGTVYVTPDTGFLNITQLTIGISGWTSVNNTAMFRIWNTTDADYDFGALLFPDYIPAS